MYLNNQYQRQDLFTNRGTLLSRNGKRAVGYFVLLVVLMAEICVAGADGLFDFQMKLAEKGNPEAEFKIGEMYETGFGTAKNMKLAEEWINKAAAQGHEMAKFKLLYWDMRKNGITKANKPQFQDMENKVKNNNAGAELYMGKIYAEGDGVPVDREKALDLYNKATLQGSVEAERAGAILRAQVKKDELASQRQQEELKAKQEELRKQQAERLAAQKKAEAARAAASVAADKRKQATAKTADDSKSQQKEQAAIAAQHAAQQAAQQASSQQTIEAKRQALLKQREESEAKRKAEFDSDPCQGKSARFLSTCH
jgi:hypothetical protein